jgi:hypothetical protein
MKLQDSGLKGCIAVAAAAAIPTVTGGRIAY